MTETVVQTDSGPKRALLAPGDEPLPEPGEARRDVLKSRKDDLAARLEAIEAELGLDSSGVKTPHVAREIEREIADRYDHTRVINPQPGFSYYWANERAAHGIDITVHKVDGWVVVSGDMPENPDDRDVRGYRIVGDVLLMRCTAECKARIDERNEYKRLARTNSVDSKLMAMSNRYQGRGINVSELNEHQLGRLARRAQARQIAGTQVNKMLHEGTVPGLGLRGVR